MPQNKIIFDSNAVLALISQRDLEQQNQVNETLLYLQNESPHYIIPFQALSEVVYVLKRVYKKDDKTIKNSLSYLFESLGMTVHNEADLDYAFGLWTNEVKDYGDSIIASVSSSNNNIPILTFDKKFRTSLKKLNIPILPVKI